MLDRHLIETIGLMVALYCTAQLLEGAWKRLGSPGVWVLSFFTIGGFSCLGLLVVNGSLGQEWTLFSTLGVIVAM